MKKLFVSAFALGCLLVAGFYLVWMRSYTLFTRGEVQTPSGAFERKAALPIPRTEGGGIAVGNSVYILGGINSFAQTLSDFHAYNALTDSWERLPDIPYPVNHPGVVTDGHKIYVVGGFGPLGIRLRGFMFAKWDPYKYLYAYDIDKKSWTRLVDMPEARGAGGVAFGAGKIWYVGGIDSARALSPKLFAYNLDESLWHEMPSVTQPRDHLRMEYVDSALFAISGRLDDLRFNLTIVEKYDLATNAWKTVASIPVGRGGLGSVVYQGNIITFGGENVWSCFDLMELYDPVQDKWTSIGPLPEGRHGIVGGVIDGQLYLISGGKFPRISVSGLNRQFKPSF